jgi:hypothetical protein
MMRKERKERKGMKIKKWRKRRINNTQYRRTPSLQV